MQRWLAAAGSGVNHRAGDVRAGGARRSGKRLYLGGVQLTQTFRGRRVLARAATGRHRKAVPVVSAVANVGIGLGWSRFR